MLTLLFGFLLSAPAMASTEALLGAIDLPVIAVQLRDDGVPDVQVREALIAARDTRLTAGEAREALHVADVSVRKHGALEAFGAFVTQQLHLGKRGKDLESAIREEHRAYGNGKVKEPRDAAPRAKKAKPAAADIVAPLDPKAQKREDRRLKKEQKELERRDKAANKMGGAAGDSREIKGSGRLVKSPEPAKKTGLFAKKAPKADAKAAAKGKK